VLSLIPVKKLPYLILKYNYIKKGIKKGKEYIKKGIY
jgi:hypothetical protein